MRKNSLIRCVFLRASALLGLGVIIFGGAIGISVGAISAESGARGKTVPYLTFGIDFNYTQGLELEY
jgi:hypothetical protein